MNSGTYGSNRMMYGGNLSHINNLRALNYDTYNNNAYKKQRAKNIFSIVTLGILSAISIVALKKNGKNLIEAVGKLFKKKGAEGAAEAAEKTSFFSKVAGIFKKNK